MTILSNCKVFILDTSNTAIVARTLALAFVLSTVCEMVDVRLPVPAALEELSIVALLLVFELSLNPWRSQNQQKQRAAKKLAKEPQVEQASSGRSERPDQAASNFTAKLQAAARAGDLEAAESIMRRMLQCGHRPSLACFGALISAAAKNSDVARAEHWLQALQDANIGSPNVICMNIVISACSKTGDVARAEHWLSMMPSMACSLTP